MGDAHDPGGPAAVIEEEVYRRREKTFGHGTAEDPFELLDALDPNRGRDRPTLGDAGEAGDVVQHAADWGPAAPADQADTGRVTIKSRRDNHQSTRMIHSQAISSGTIATDRKSTRLNSSH